MKKLASLFFALFMLFPLCINAQDKDIRIDFFDAEFFFIEEEYVDALYSYKKVYEAGYQDNANINYRMGVCYLNISGEKQKAIPFLEKAVKKISTDWKEGSFKEESAPVDALLYLGNAYRINKNIEKACYTYNEYINKLETEDEKVQAYAKMQIDACQRARLAYLNPKDVQIENLGTKYNTNLDNFQPVLSADGTKMAFMSEKKFYDAVYFVQKKNGQWLNPINITPQIQSDGNQYVTSLSHDGSKMLLAKVDNFDSDIVISEYSSMHWSKSKNIGKPVNSKYFEYHACLSADGKTLYFTSNRPESIGEMDIFVSHLNEEGTWTEPENIGATINTIFNESSPFISLDGKTLYFSSQGHNNIGGFDIFKSTLNENGEWNSPVALPYPVNTPDDDIFYYPINDEKGYMSRVEKDGMGKEDIYLIDLTPPEKLAVNEIKEEANTPDSSGIAKKEDKLEEVAKVEESKAVKTDDNIIESRKKESEKQYHLKPVFFGFDSYALSDNAKQKLNLVKTLIDNYPEISIVVIGHTDALGPDAYNQYLSEKRAESVVQYLTSIGVDKSKLSIKGLSENKPVAINKNSDGTDSRKGRQLNRRVGFEIRSDMKNIIVDPVEVPENLLIRQE